MNKRKPYVIFSLFFAVLAILPMQVEAKNIDFYINNITSENITKISDKNESIVLVAANVVEDCSETYLGCTDEEDDLAWLLQKILNYIKILGPTIAIIMGTLDFTKAIVASDEEQMKKAQSKFVKRLIAAVALFFIPLLVELLLGIFGITGISATGGLK